MKGSDSSGGQLASRVEADPLRHALAHGFAIVAVLVPIWILVLAERGHSLALDFRGAFLPGARAVIHGASPYHAVGSKAVTEGIAFLYPPLTAYVLAPFTLLPPAAAGVLAVVLVAATVPATLLALEVRDWRCYACAFLWFPVVIGIQTANVTLPLVLGLALVWRYRDRRAVGALVAGLLIAVKLFFWPCSSGSSPRAATGALRSPRLLPRSSSWCPGRASGSQACAATHTSWRASRAAKGLTATRSPLCSTVCCRAGPRRRRSRGDRSRHSPARVASGLARPRARRVRTDDRRRPRAHAAARDALPRGACSSSSACTAPLRSRLDRAAAHLGSSGIERGRARAEGARPHRRGGDPGSRTERLEARALRPRSLRHGAE